MLPAWASRWRRVSCVVLTTAALLSSTTHLAFAQPAPDAKALLADGDKATKAKDWAAASKAYEASNKAAPSSEALDGLANAQYSAGQLGESHASYTEWLDKYGSKAPAAKKQAAEKRVKEIFDKTGALAITVNEAGALVAVDDKPFGTTPLPGALRLPPGPHRIRITKDGFITFDQAPNVSIGGSTPLQVTLATAGTKGKVVVKEKSGRAVRITVDGVDMGDAPWTGDVEAGQHEIGIRAPGLVAAPQRITVERGKTQDVELAASSSSASVKLHTDDGKGLIYLDGKLVGEGNFVGDIPSGPHKLRVTRDGYDPFEEEITVKDKEPYGRTITLKLSGKIETGPVQNIERLEGIYGGFTVLGMFTPGGTNNDIEQRCDSQKDKPAREIASCDAGGGSGGGVGGFVGYHWDPVGMEIFIAGQYDQMKMKTDWNAASTALGAGSDPARTENFTLRRAGGMALARIRVTKQWSKIRLSFAGGVGASYRVMFLERETIAADNGARDLFVSDNGPSYISPVISLEPSVSYRITSGVAVSLGMQMFVDAPSTRMFGGENPVTVGEGNHVLAGQAGTPPRGLTTLPYVVAADTQVFIGPHLGMMFGP